MALSSMKNPDPNEKKYQASDKKDIIDWYNKYYNSLLFKKNLYDKGNAYLPDESAEVGKNTANKINNLKYTYNDYNSSGYPQPTAYNLQNTINLGNPNNYFNQSKSAVLAHELGHVNQDEILSRQPRNLAIMLNRNQAVNRKNKANEVYEISNEMPPKYDDGRLMYPAFPSIGSYRQNELKDWIRHENNNPNPSFHDQLLGETRGDIMALRYIAAKEGIWDASSNKPGTFNSEMLNKLYKSKSLNTPEIKKDNQGNISTNEPSKKSISPSDLKDVAPPEKPGMILNRLKEKYSDSDLLYLMNNLAKINLLDSMKNNNT